MLIIKVGKVYIFCVYIELYVYVYVCVYKG